MLHQRARQLATAVHQDVLTGLLFQPGDLFRDISLDQGCVPREWFFRVVEATNFGRLLIRSTYPASPGPSSAAVLEDQASAKPLYVSRPISRASDAKS